LGQAIGNQLRGGEIIALTGELGAGKTLLAKGIASGVGISPEHVTSPTFTFIHEYSGQLRLVHADLYRINNLDELKSIGLEDYYDPSTAVVIEWADRMGPDFSHDYLRIHLAHTQRYIRLATLQAHGPLSHALLKRLRTGTE
jgi:tRNA threonylcarbamoyladenosine biosynthesis protein TsaE